MDKNIVLTIIGLLIFVYLFLIKPRKKADRLREGMLACLEVGDAIETTTGMYGTIVELIDDEKIMVQFGDARDGRFVMSRAGIMRIEKPVRE